MHWRSAVLVDQAIERRQQFLAADVTLPELLAGVHGVRHVVRVKDLFRDDVQLVPHF